MDNGTVFNLFLLLFPSFSSTDEKERVAIFPFGQAWSQKSLVNSSLTDFAALFCYLNEWYFDFGAKMLDKMLTEENDSSLTSFFILFENASIASRVRGGIRYALHFF